VRDARAVLQRALVRSKVVDTEALCIKGGVVVWHVRLDLKILDHGGNLTDCATIAGACCLFPPHARAQAPHTIDIAFRHCIFPLLFS
jgi:exosome complex RNA-binding protein Rrp42 (RNase PH superfamily)